MPNGYALTIGLNAVDPSHYQGWSGELIACESDATDLAAVFAQCRFTSVETLLTTDATRSIVIGSITNLASLAVAGDLVVITYSGHGGQVPDRNGDEIDSADETWCLYDGELIDDELYVLLAQFVSGVRVLVLSDSCHSGTVLKAAQYQALVAVGALNTLEIPNPYSEAVPAFRAMPPQIAARTYSAHRAMYDALQPNPPIDTDSIPASVLLISGCQDNQLSMDGTFNGLFTGTLLSVWSGGKFAKNYKKFHNAIVKRMPLSQTPNFYQVGVHDAAFINQTPFKI